LTKKQIKLYISGDKTKKRIETKLIFSKRKGNLTVKIGIGCDHNAYPFKTAIKGYLEEQQYEVVDFGCEQGEETDYPDVAFEVARAISDGEIERGILICGTGIGVAIAAGKYPGIRAALTHDTYSAERAQKSNNAQIITMGAQVIGVELGKQIVQAFLTSTFDANRSGKKVQKIIDKEQQLLASGMTEETRTSCS
jgi:ribose 5-phosphate isomerase B